MAHKSMGPGPGPGVYKEEPAPVGDPVSNSLPAAAIPTLHSFPSLCALFCYFPFRDSIFGSAFQATCLVLTCALLPLGAHEGVPSGA